VNTESAPFFIVGAQRSGSTLLRLILNAHSQIAVPEEARFLVPLLKWENVTRTFSGDRLRRLRSYIADHPQFALWNYDASDFLTAIASREQIGLHDFIDRMYRSFCAAEKKTVWGDKSLFFAHIPVLHALFPEAKFIHIVRDGRDVFHSWRRIDPTKDNAAVVALDWRYKLRKVEGDFARLPDTHHLTIRYEDLLAEPQAVLARVCALVGVDYESTMLDFYKTSRFYIGQHHSELIFSPLDKANAEKWRRTLTPREQRIFGRLARAALVEFGYQESDRWSFADLMAAAVELAWGLPQRLGQVLGTKLITERAVRTGETPASLTVGERPEAREQDAAERSSS
jgi:hypothetical protein